MPSPASHESVSAAFERAGSDALASAVGTLRTTRRPVEVPVGPAARAREAAARPSPSDSPAPSPPRPLRIAAVVPCFNRRPDAEALLGDLLRIDQTGIDLRVILVDNASDVPLSTLKITDADGSPTEPWFRLEHLRLSQNTGGSGGYNAGMRRALEYAADPDAGPWDPDYIWMVDSDARVAPDTLARLLQVTEADPSIAAAGSAIADPLSGQVFELGGHINRRNGNYEPYVMGLVGVRGLVEADYVAACCALVRASAVRMTGVMPDRFLNGDDVEWFVRIGQVTGGRIVGVPDSIAMHPRFDRFPTWTRYYTTRNAFGPIACVNRGFKTRRIKARREAVRAVQQCFMGREDLSALHVRALADAGSGIVDGKAEPGVINVLPMQPFSRLAPAIEEALIAQSLAAPTLRPRLRVRIMPHLLLTDAEERAVLDQLAAAGLRKWTRVRAYNRNLYLQLFGVLLRGIGLAPRPHVAVVPARGQAFNWFSAPIQVQVTTGGFVIRRPARLATVLRAAAWWVRSRWHMYRAALKTPPPPRMFPAEMVRPSPVARASDSATGAGKPETAVSLCAVVLSHSRPDALARTVAALAQHPLFTRSTNGAPAPGRILIAHNASDSPAPSLTDLRERHPAARIDLADMGANLGVEAFNRAAAEAFSDAPPSPTNLLLILDDDAVVEPAALIDAVRLLERRPDLAAVTFHPRHPVTAASEWPFFESVCRNHAGRRVAVDLWPVMGCANLVRADVWQRLGGYESTFFLYRNDTDLALRILDATQGPSKVHFDPNWIVWHDTPAVPGSPKSERWHRLATRNWIWTCRRNARGRLALQSALAGYLWAHRLAGRSLSRHLATLRGGLDGLRSTPTMPQGTTRSGKGLKRLLKAQIQFRRQRAAARRSVRA
ncbi:MAG: glycosyltransferase [Phycisphaeraceae bacterium]|nr:glycosyltransferase [Phycisphaeraceae bacterium]